MVSWDLKVKFLGLSPNIKELVQLAKKHNFSNIEEIRYNKDGTHTLIVNYRGLNQTELKSEVIG